jgi:hypothetical protein
MAFAKRDHPLKETKHILVRLQTAPIEPRTRSIHVVRIPVPELCLEKLIAGTKHGSAVGKQEEAKEVFNLFLAQGHHSSANIRLSVSVTAVPALG